MNKFTLNAKVSVLTLLAGVGLCSHLDIIGREEPGDPVDFSFPPIGVVLVEDVDQLTFLERHLVPIGCFVVIHGNDLAH